ncbi:VWA domain-containing protein [Actinomarinicola tropica]|uniref:VWA domain-containing protein n=1 Tax=Actinomarinicola tropica TaxID=2789776 RepID=A0A5Q2RT66_9ACTN|nr:VWA domain-containing protein [Actinomarinicola tropica]
MTTGVDRAVVGFVAALRRAGLVVPVGSTVLFVQALGEVGLDDRAGAYWAGRATLVTRPEDVPVYDEVFRAYWDHGAAAVLRGASAPERITVALDDGEDDPSEAPDESGDEEGPVLSVRYSAQEVLRERDFASCTDEELAEAHRLMDRMRVVSARRPSRRRRHVGEAGARIDLGRTLRDALRRGGETTRLSTTAPGERPRRLVLLVDISGSMEPYARSLVRFVHAAVVGRARVEAFTLGTQLTRITRELASRDPDAAVARAADAVEDWSGGTRLGEMLRTFNDQWGVRGMARGAVVVILSDGWDRGDPDLLAEQMGRLHRVAHRVVWVNPLKATPGYEPLARGMAAALPFVDTFIAGHSLAALEHLAEEIAA